MRLIQIARRQSVILLLYGSELPNTSVPVPVPCRQLPLSQPPGRTRSPQHGGAGEVRAEEPPLQRALPAAPAAPAQPTGPPQGHDPLHPSRSALDTPPGEACSHVLNGIYHALAVSSPALSPASRPPGRTLPASSIRRLSLRDTPDRVLTSFPPKQGRARCPGKAASCCCPHPDTRLRRRHPGTGKPQPHRLHGERGLGMAAAPRVAFPRWDERSWAAFLTHHLTQAVAASSFWHRRVRRPLARTARARLLHHLAVWARSPEPIAAASGKGMCRCGLAATAVPLYPADRPPARFVGAPINFHLTPSAVA